MFRIYRRIFILNFFLFIFSLSIFTVNTFFNDVRFLSVIKQSRITENDNIIKIEAHYDNLATIKINLESLSTNSKNIYFVLKENDSNKILYEAIYSKTNLELLPNYPFGFPPISNSQGKIYSVLLKPQYLYEKLSLLVNPNIELLYKFDKEVVLKPNKIGSFIIIKINQYFQSAYLSGGIYFYLLPFFLYYMLVVIDKYISSSFKRNIFFKQISTIDKPSQAFIVLIIFFSSLLSIAPSDKFIIIISIVWILIMIGYKQNSQKTFSIALLFLLLCPALILSNLKIMADNMAIWSYIFMLLGTVSALIESKITKIKYLYYIQDILKFITFIDNWIIFQAKCKYDLFFSTPRNIFKFIVYILVAFTVIVTISITYIKLMKIRDRQLKNPIIRVAEPDLVYHTTKVVLLGESFGGKSDERNRLIQNGKEVRTDYWEDHKIIFTVPLDWQPGNIDIWIEKPIQWNGETIIEKTKPITIKLLKVTDKFTSDDELYFEQIKSWRQETKELNGYK